MSFKILNKEIYFSWKWPGLREEMCGICQMTFQEVCTKCKYPGIDCPPTVGSCGHEFHLHCIDEWLKSRGPHEKICPLCRQVWKEAK
eukprot:GAHX01001751.1.p1 GENE.GAHX01001751.1~~GAHX01001751.1.p1  ORF type:complete len:87 (+),score=6.86 GAHX01001751.1:109-369(+)